MRKHRLRWIGAGAALVAIAVFSVTFASAQEPVQHGISATKGCVSPTVIDSPYLCTYSIRNNVDDAHDTLTINSFVDNVFAASGIQSSGNVLNQLRLVFIQDTAVSPPS